MSRKLFLVFLLLIFVVACSSKESVSDIQQELAETEAGVGEITEKDCPLKVTGEKEGESYYCGIYTVPVDYGNPQDDTLNLTYVVLRATGNNPLPDPIVYLAGGPGQSGIVAAGGDFYGDLRHWTFDNFEPSEEF